MICTCKLSRDTHAIEYVHYAETDSLVSPNPGFASTSETLSYVNLGFTPAIEVPGSIEIPDLLLTARGYSNISTSLDTPY
ncbi:hypothetical protein VTP01DRAFT_627, partial [Rhizomucor pusillus]|uniref:uncharacterized protein n=1 Tax=Rhizomucor pusillus TaxID=4840 RepID=UPI0037433E66